MKTRLFLFFLRHPSYEKMVKQHVFKICAWTHSCSLHLERIYVPLKRSVERVYVPLKRSVAWGICGHQGSLNVCTLSLNDRLSIADWLPLLAQVSAWVWEWRWHFPGFSPALHLQRLNPWGSLTRDPWCDHHKERGLSVVLTMDWQKHPRLHLVQCG